MKTPLVNINKISDTNELKFKSFNTPLSTDWIDVYFKGQRIAIINGLVSPLQWVAKNGSNIPLRIIDKLEKYCMRNAIQHITTSTALPHSCGGVLVAKDYKKMKNLKLTDKEVEDLKALLIQTVNTSDAEDYSDSYETILTKLEK